MKKRTIITVLGILVALLPLVDVPTSWKNSMMVLFGLIIALMAGVRPRPMIIDHAHDATAPTDLPRGKNSKK